MFASPAAVMFHRQQDARGNTGRKSRASRQRVLVQDDPNHAQEQKIVILGLAAREKEISRFRIHLISFAELQRQVQNEMAGIMNGIGEGAPGKQASVRNEEKVPHGHTIT